MKDWKIGTRIGFGFAIATAITVTLGGLAHHEIDVIDKASYEIYGNSLPSVEVIAPIGSNARSVLGLMLEQLDSTDDHELKRLDTETADLRAKNVASFQKYESLFSNDHDRQLFGAIVTAQAGFWKVGEEVLQLSRLNTNASRNKALLLIPQLGELQRDLIRTVDAELVFNQGIADEDSKTIAASVKSANISILVAAAFAIIAATIIYLLVMRRITRPLAEAVQLVDFVAEGDLTVQMTAQGDEDILGNALVKMLDSLRNTFVKSPPLRPTSPQEAKA